MLPLPALSPEFTAHTAAVAGVCKDEACFSSKQPLLNAEPSAFLSAFLTSFVLSSKMPAWQKAHVHLPSKQHAQSCVSVIHAAA